MNLESKVRNQFIIEQSFLHCVIGHMGRLCELRLPFQRQISINHQHYFPIQRFTDSQRLIFASKLCYDQCCYYNHMTRAGSRRQILATMALSQTLQNVLACKQYMVYSKLYYLYFNRCQINKIAVQFSSAQLYSYKDLCHL